MPETRILSILLHVGDWRAATDWYARAFPAARRLRPASDDYGHLEMDGLALEIVEADEKVASGAAGTVVYWRVADSPSRSSAWAGSAPGSIAGRWTSAAAS